MLSSQIKETWTEVRRVEQALIDEFGDSVFITSKDSKKRRVKAGVTTIATPYVAAMMIVDETHLLATPEEVKAWKEHHARVGKEQRERAAQRDAKVHVNLGDLVDRYVRLDHVPLTPPLATPQAPPPVPVQAATSAAADGRGDL